MAMEGSQETAQIVSQVATLDGKIRGLNQERSPMISLIPLEVLSRIIWFATGSNDQATTSRLSEAKSLFKLRSVCSYWRRAVDSSSHLWTTLGIKRKLSHDQREAALKHYRRCLRAAALSIYINDSKPLTGVTVDEIIGITLKELPRRRSPTRLPNGSGSIQNSNVNHARGDVAFPLLEELDLHWSRHGQQWEEITVFHNSPRLRTLSITVHRSRQIPLNVLSLPWGQLTTLNLDDTGPKYASLLLILCPNLVNHKLSYGDEDDKPWMATQSQITSMQFLRDLAWCCSDQTELNSRRQQPKPLDPQFFECFRFPAVRKLEWVVPLPSGAPSVRDFFMNMQALEELIFDPSEWQYCIDQHLGAFNNLTKLEAYIPDDELEEGYSKWLYRLTIKRGHDNLFPHLQTLHLTLWDVGPNAQIVMLYSRRNGPVDWSDVKQAEEELVLPPYDPASTHWQHHTRLLEFSSAPYDNRDQIDWSWSPHYEAMKTMMLEAREVEGFEVEQYRSRILF